MSTQIIYRGEQEVTVAETVFTLEFEVEADVTYCPAVIGGPPESCSPDESELDITETTLLSCKDAEGNLVEVHGHAAGRLLGALDQDKIEQGIWDEFHSQRCNSMPDYE